MGFRYLLGFCFALLSFSSLAAPVSVEVAAGTTTYKVTSTTVRTPANVAFSAAKDITPYVERLPSGGLSQTVQGRLIVAVPQSSPPVTVPMNGAVNVSKTALKTAVKGFARTVPYLGTGLLVVDGLQTVLNNTGWFFNDDGLLVAPGASTGVPPSDPSYWGSAPDGVTYYYGDHYYGDPFSAVSAALSASLGCTTGGCVLTGAENISPNCLEELGNQCAFRPTATKDGFPHSGGYMRSVSVINPTNSPPTCSSGVYDPARYGCVSSDEAFEPVSDEDFDAAIDEFYEPEPADWPHVFPFIPDTAPETADFTPPASVLFPPRVETVTVGDDTVVTEYSDMYDFTVQGNSTSQPSVDVDFSESWKEYKNGSLTGSGSNSTRYPSLPSDLPIIPPDEGSPPGGDSIWPDFCSWASAVCDWLDWTKEPINEPEPDLSSILTDEDFERNYDINFGDNSCPAPIPLNIALINKTVELSYEPACEFAGYANPFVLISAYLFAIYITLGVIRNG